MKTSYCQIPQPGLVLVRLGWAITLALLLISPHLLAATTVTTLGGGNPNVTPKYQGYKDGTTLTTALFRTPYALALDEVYSYLYVADRDNNAVRIVDLALGQTYTFVPTNLTTAPVGVAVDGTGNVFVLNRGSGGTSSTTGNVLMFDTYGDLLATNATKLTNAASIALDTAGNIYVTVKGNTLMRIATNGTKTVVATIPNAGTSLQGIVVKHNGLIAACDAGRHGIYLINPTTGVVTTNAGFNGIGDGTGTANHGILKANALFNQPMGVTEVGDGSLIVSDTGNHRIKVINATVVTNLCGVSSNYWGGSFPGWYDGPVKVPDSTAPNAQSRLPVGVAFASDGTVYTTEDYYHLIRKVTGAGLPQPPPPPPQVPTPQIGWVDFPATATPAYSSVFHPVSSFVFNNDAPIIIRGTAGSQTYYSYLNTPNIGLVPDPTASSASASMGYQDGLDSVQVNALAVAGIAPYVAIKAIGEKNDGSPNSAIAQAVFQFVTANPNIGGNNAAQFIISDITFGATLYYTTDGSDPKSSPSAVARGFNPSTNLIINTAAFNFSSNNFLFKCFARKANYQDSGVVSNYFSAAGFTPNRISFGLTNGEPSSTFIARPGQVYYSPVTLQLQPGGETMYSLQFNISVTNGLANPNKILNGAGIGFFSMLMSQVPPEEGLYYPPAAGQWFLTIPPVILTGSNTAPVSSVFTNINNNLLGVGWLYRTGFKYKLTDTNSGRVVLDFDTAKQDLIAYSIAHDTLFSKGSGTVIAGAYSFLVPATTSLGDQYFIQLGSPSATRDGVGAPGADVYIQAPAASQAVTVGSPTYMVGDAAPFRWLNAGDFGEGMLNNADVMQVYQCAIAGVDLPPANSDLFLAMDSSGTLGNWDSVNHYYTDSATSAGSQALFDGNDQTINTNAFGDGAPLDVADVYVTYRRSLDPSLVWFNRYWTNGQFVAVPTANLAFNSNTPHLLVSKAVTKKTANSSYQQSSVTFSAGDAVNTAGATVQIPITATVYGSYPLRVLGLNLTVYPLDGSPAITTPVLFTPATTLGQPTITSAKSAANYSAAWLNSGITGLTGATTIGTLTVTLPTNATSSAAYVIHFDHASASPNGLASFPEQKLTGLITLTSRTNSYYNDGIPDAWRLRWFGTLYNSLSVSNADACGDGINNYKKFIAGTDPTVAGSYPQLKSKTPVPAGSTTAIHWPTVSGKKYAIERATSLFSGAWTTITTNTGTGTDMEFNDNSAGTVKFYRVRILP